MSETVRVKLDENLGSRGAALFRSAGFDVATVFQQELASASDATLFDVCGKENRCLVTLDLDFSNPFFFDPTDSAGVAVVRLPSNPTADDLFRTLEVLIKGLSRADIRGRLWIVQRHRIREYRPDEGG
ncbi:MAG TPA: DUF5615 family PIN-like protein [Thermoguttaceae bacterium]|nr:DUF5615 family PIN-like protein [Thermoguttaceae bacterium]